MIFNFNNTSCRNSSIVKIDLPEKFDDNVYLDIWTDKAESIKIYFDRNILSFIFGYGILNCLTNAISSEYSFDRVIDFMNAKDYIEIIKRYTLNPIVKYYIKKKYNLVLRHNIFILNKMSEDASIHIKVSTRYGFIKMGNDRFTLRKLNKNFDACIKLSAKEVFDLINFSSENSIVPHSS